MQQNPIVYSVTAVALNLYILDIIDLEGEIQY